MVLLDVAAPGPIEMLTASTPVLIALAAAVVLGVFFIVKAIKK